MLTFFASSVEEAPHCVSCLCLTRRIMGVEVQSIQERVILWWKNVAVCCCILPASWKHIFGLPSAFFLLDQSSPYPSWAYLYFPVVFIRHTNPAPNRRKIKLALHSLSAWLERMTCFGGRGCLKVNSHGHHLFMMEWGFGRGRKRLYSVYTSFDLERAILMSNWNVSLDSLVNFSLCFFPPSI